MRAISSVVRPSATWVSTSRWRGVRTSTPVLIAREVSPGNGSIPSTVCRLQRGLVRPSPEGPTGPTPRSGSLLAVAITIGLLLAGAVVLYVGAELAVRGASRLARAAGIPAFALGALLFGIDLEGTGTAVVAAARDQTEIAAGEIFGTVLFLFSAAFGAALLLAREPIPSPPPVMVLAPAAAILAATLAIFDRYVDRLEGALLVVLYLAYVLVLVRHERARGATDKGWTLEGPLAERAEKETGPPLVAVAGLAFLAGGALLLVGGGTRLVSAVDLLPGFVGAAVVGVLASLDEVLLEILPVRRGHHELATGNLFGTLAAFTSGVLGVAALVRPLDLDGAANAAFLGMTAMYAAVATTFLVRDRAGRVLGTAVLVGYAVWLGATAA